MAALGYFGPDTDSNAWGLPHISDAGKLKELSAWVFSQEGQLYLAQQAQPELPAITLDFTSGRTAHRLKQTKHTKLPLAKACGISKGQRPSIIDATAGFAQDGLLLAAMGSKVTMLEQHPLLYALVADALVRARAANLSWLTSILANISHHQSNSCDYLARHQAEVVYLDPMYPERERASSARVKKGMQILRNLPECYTDSERLLNAALSAARHRVVVKRPSWADSIGNQKPDTVVSMPNHHFDIYLA